MTLEDHVGDIIGKARISANVSIEDIARSAGLTPEEYERFEEKGESSKPVDFQSIASLVGLCESKLRHIAEGWTPEPVDLARWRHLERITTRGMGMDVHCYLVWDEDTREAALFDTGFDMKPIFELITQRQLQLEHLFITHTHHDHIAALSAIRERIPTVQLHSDSRHAPTRQRIQPSDEFAIGKLRITNRETPGHAEDGVTYVIEGWPDNAPTVAIVGDAIFAGSMGGARENADLAKKKNREQIFTLPDEALICPGHGPFTTVQQEKANNPFFL